MKLLSDKDLAARFSVNVSYVWKLAKEAPGFPKAVRLGEAIKGTEFTARQSRATRWVEAEIDAWFATRFNKEPVHDGSNQGEGAVATQDQ